MFWKVGRSGEGGGLDRMADGGWRWEPGRKMMVDYRSLLHTLLQCSTVTSKFRGTWPGGWSGGGPQRESKREIGKRVVG